MAAFDHLVDLGHQHIGYLSTSAALHQQGFGPAVRSLAGYEKARQKHEITTVYREIEPTTQAMYEATLQMISQHPQLTAIVALNGQTAVAIIRALRKLGRIVPDNFSVVAIASDRSAQLVMPPLTAVDLPSYQMGARAAEMLINRLQDDTAEVNQILLPPNLVIRQTTGQPPK
jgi:DNA-binding LacI/PurR family transcriptional regulator